MSRRTELLAQLFLVHKVYGLRLIVFLRILREIAGASRLAECISAVVSHNEQWERLLSDEGKYVKLAGKNWSIEHAQQVYKPLIAIMLSDTTPLCGLRGRYDVQRATEEHNADVFGDDTRRYFDLGMFPTFMIEHFFHIRNLLEALNEIEYTPSFEQVRQFIVWLDEQLMDPS